MRFRKKKPAFFHTKLEKTGSAYRKASLLHVLTYSVLLPERLVGMTRLHLRHSPLRFSRAAPLSVLIEFLSTPESFAPSAGPARLLKNINILHQYLSRDSNPFPDNIFVRIWNLGTIWRQQLRSILPAINIWRTTSIVAERLLFVKKQKGYCLTG